MLSAVIELEESGIYTNYGPVNERFERQLESRLFGLRDSVLTTCNATIALMMAVRHAVAAHGRDRAGYALMPAFTFAAAAHAAEWAGQALMLCDIDPSNWAGCPHSEERMIARFADQIAVIMPYATFGTCIDLERYDWISRRTGIPVVVDAAASIGSLDAAGRAFGAGFAQPVVYSMHATKVFSTAEGGIIHCADPDVIRSLRQMGNFGFSQPRTATMPGLNSKLSEIGALLGLAQLDRHEQVVLHRETLAAHYRRSLPGWRFQTVSGTRQAHTFMAAVPPDCYAGPRQHILDELNRAGIGASSYFSPHLGEQPYFAGRVLSDDLPVTRRIASRIIALPLWDGMSVGMVDTVCGELRRIVPFSDEVASLVLAAMPALAVTTACGTDGYPC